MLKSLLFLFLSFFSPICYLNAGLQAASNRSVQSSHSPGSAVAVLGSSGHVSRPPGRSAATSSLTLPLGAALGSDGQSDARPMLRLLGVGALQAAAPVSVPCLSDPVRAPTKLVSEGRAIQQRVVQ